MIRRIITAALAAAVLCCAGCSTLDAIAKRPAASALAVQYATAKVIELGKTTDERLARAARIKTIALDAQKYATGDAVTVDALQQLAIAQIAQLNLGTADMLLANALVQTAVEELQSKIGVGVIPPDKLTTVNQLLGWVITATELYGA
jgi:hypothetical protein